MIGRMQIKARTPLDAGSQREEAEGAKSKGTEGAREGLALPGELEVAATRVRIVS